MTYYVAEFWNTASSLTICVHGLWGIWKHRWAERRVQLAFATFLVVGVGSVAFHATLWRSMQLMDELPMLWGNCIFLFTLTSMEVPQGRSTARLALASLAYTVLATLAVLLFDGDDQGVFLVTYGSVVVWCMYRGYALDCKYNAGGGTALYELSMVFYLLGLLAWAIDRTWCASVQPLHLHAAWHVCASLGSFSTVLHWTWVRQRVLKRRAVVASVLPLQYVAQGQPCRE